MQSSAPDLAHLRAHRLSQFLFLTYGLTLSNTFGFLRHASFTSVPATLYTLAVYLSYSALYLVPAILLIVAAQLSFRTVADESCTRFWTNARRSLLVYALAIFVTGATQVILFADRTVFTIFGMHINGFVWNTVFTSGGLESMGESAASKLVYAGYVAGLFSLQTLILLLVLKVPVFDRGWRRVMSRSRRIVAWVALATCLVGGSIGYGFSDIHSYSPVLMSASAFPLYVPTTFRHLAQRMGLEVLPRGDLPGGAADGRLEYPLSPIDVQPPPHPFNIVWLVSESLRADMLDPEIMPAASRFAERAHRFNRHYSGGNGTRMGMFSMFYGMYGNLWFTFLREQHAPVVIDVLQQLGYRMKMFTSAHFSYPEFDRTVFAKIPAEQLHEEVGGPGWDRDRRNVGEIISFLGEQTPQQPFMTFMFFESPHSRYYFPDESVIRTPYLEDFDYATVDLDHDMPLIKNRYINACHHLDSQIARVLDELEQRKLLDSTIVLITGDHGEAFMEKGRWGHNSDFTEEQVRTPMVLWVPGTGESVSDRLTSHLDVVPTLLPLLGVTNPTEDYALGTSLLNPCSDREYIVMADWSRIAYLDGTFKASFPIQVGGVLRSEVTTPDDRTVADPGEFFRTRRSQMQEIMKDIGRFVR